MFAQNTGFRLQVIASRIIKKPTTYTLLRITSKKGFTLIEIMITVSIIAILAAVGLTSYSHAQMLARDAQRKQDLSAIATALELYRQDNGRYPCNTSFARSTNPTSFWITDSNFEACDLSATDPKILGTNYINKMPNDPKSNDVLEETGDVGAEGYIGGKEKPFFYGYWYRTPTDCPSTTTGQFYTLRTRLENKNDPDTCKFKQNKSCDNVSICSTPGTIKEEMFIITSPH